MACGSSCCGPPKEPQAATAAPSPIREVNPALPAVLDVTNPVCEASIPSTCVEDRGCCDAGAEPQSNCCLPAAPRAVDCGKDPECCKGKASPCCDSTCIDRLALRECEKACCETASHSAPDDDADSSASTSRKSSKAAKPCGRHSGSAREKYQATLEALGCICRALLALGQESCCAPPPPPPSSVERNHSGRRGRITRPSAPEDSCCATGVSASVANAEGRRPKSKRGCRRGGPEPKGDSCSAGCCAKAPPATPTPRLSGGSCADGCCSEEKPPDGAEKGNDVLISDAAQPADLERGIAGQEHIVLSVSGMTCTGCETKLQRTLAKLGFVRNLKSSLVLARAEFDLDTGSGSLADVMKHLERTTEFKCERVTNRGSSIDLILLGDPEELVNRAWPHGVTGIQVVDKTTIHVEFDAKIIGARDLVESGWGDTPVTLAPPRPDPTLESGSRHVRHIGYMTLLSAILTVPVLVMAWAPLPERDIAYSSASLALATIVQFVVAGPFYPKALKALVFSRIVEMDLLIVLSTTTAYIFSVVSFGYLVAGQPLSTGQFFETSTLLVTLIMVGRYVSSLARQKAVESISVRSLQSPTAIVLAAEDREMEIDARLLQYGDIFKVMPDSRIPTDGTVISGSSELDESMITGESMPVEKHPGSPVVAGSTNGSGTLTVRLTRVPGDNTISTIAGMVDEAKLSKPKLQDLADRVASYFVPVVVALTTITFIAWVAVGVAVRKQSGSEATIKAITYAITVLIVSCPCAIGLAVPMVIVVASGVAAERGVIFKSANSIEVAYKAAHVVFDKTGTITMGKLGVTREEYLSSNPDSTKSLLLGLVGGIKHPVSSAIAGHLKASGVSAAAVTDSKALTGKGVEGSVFGRALRAGNSRWLGLTSEAHVQSIISQGYTAFCFTVDGTLAAVFGLEDSLRPDALTTVSRLHDSGIAVHILSGDDDGAVRAAASQLSVPDANVRSRCTPADKQTYIQHLQSAPSSPVTHSFKTSRRRRPPVVIFCGDGTNDAIALAQATVGIHTSTGSDAARSAADVVLMREGPSGVLVTVGVSRAATRRIAFNFGWSFVYNLAAVLLGSGAVVVARIPPEFAGLGELVSVLPVIAAAVGLRWAKV